MTTQRRPHRRKRERLRRRIKFSGETLDIEDEEAYWGRTQTPYISQEHIASTLGVGLLVARAMLATGQIPGGYEFGGRLVCDATKFWDYMLHERGNEDYRPPVEEPLVYFVQAEGDPTSPIKIGSTTTLGIVRRLSSLQTGNPRRLLVLATTIGDETIEAQLHERFAAERLRGEWFTPSEALLSYIAALRA